jgi:hypothetical protein
MVRRFDAQRPGRPPRVDRRRPSCVRGRPGRRVGLTRMCSSAPPRLLERGSRSRSRGRSLIGDSNLSPISGSRQRRPRAIHDVSSASTVVCLYSQNRSLLRSWGNRVSVTSGASVGEGACLERDPQRALPVPGTDGKPCWWGRTVAGPPPYPSGRSWCGFGLSSKRIEDAWISATRAPPRPSRT